MAVTVALVHRGQSPHPVAAQRVADVRARLCSLLCTLLPPAPLRQLLWRISLAWDIACPVDVAVRIVIVFSLPGCPATPYRPGAPARLPTKATLTEMLRTQRPDWLTLCTVHMCHGYRRSVPMLTTLINIDCLDDTIDIINLATFLSC